MKTLRKRKIRRLAPEKGSNKAKERREKASMRPKARYFTVESGFTEWTSKDRFSTHVF
jgi:hypothetical protein